MPTPRNARRAGSRRHRLRIERPATATGEFGHPAAGDWTTVCPLWASVEAIGGRERWLAQQANATTTHRIETVFVSGIDETMRADWNGRKLYFESVDDPDGGRRDLVILAHERKGN